MHHALCRNRVVFSVKFVLIHNMQVVGPEIASNLRSFVAEKELHRSRRSVFSEKLDGVFTGLDVLQFFVNLGAFFDEERVADFSVLLGFAFGLLFLSDGRELKGVFETCRHVAEWELVFCEFY